MKLVTFGTDKDRNLIIQFPIFIQPYTQQPLILYQLQTVPLPIIDENPNAQSYTELKIKKPYILILELILLYRTCFDCQRQAFKLSELFIRSEDNQTTMPLYGLLS